MLFKQTLWNMAGEVKRMHRNASVMVAPCDATGAVDHTICEELASGLDDL
jgi:hypothetical protein